MNDIHWFYRLCAVIIGVAILNGIAMELFVPSPTVVQYRFAIILLCFALSSLAAMVFTAKVKMSGTVGVLTVAFSGAAVLWLGAFVVITYLLPEQPIERASESAIQQRIAEAVREAQARIEQAANTPRQVEFLLIFPPDPSNSDLPDPRAPKRLNESLRVTGYVQRDAPAPVLDETFRHRPSPGGLIGTFPNAKPNDLLYVRTDDGVHKWRSFPVLVPPQPVLQMLPDGGQP